MNTLLRFLPLGLLGLSCAGMLGLIQLRRAPASRDRAELAPLVETVPARRCDDGFHLRVDGEVIPYREIGLAAEVHGRVVLKAEAARAGRYVEQGNLLFQIDPQEYELEVRRLQESVKQASSSIEEADVEATNVQELIGLANEQLELQRADLARFESLRKRNAASDSQLEAARQAELQVLNTVQSLKNQSTLIRARRNRLVQEKEQALASLDLARLHLDRTRITSPIDGIVIQDFAEEDDYVQAGSALAQLEDTSKVEVRFSLPLDRLRWLWSADDVSPLTQHRYALPDATVRVHVEIDDHHFFWPARLDRYDGAGLNASTRTAPMIATVDDPTAVERLDKADQFPLAAPPALLRGTFVSVEIPVGSAFELVSIPTAALRPGGDVWTWRDGKLHIASVNVAQATEDEVILLVQPGQLAAGDQVITSPLPLAIQGMDVRRVDDTRRRVNTSAVASDKRPDSI